MDGVFKGTIIIKMNLLRERKILIFFSGPKIIFMKISNTHNTENIVHVYIQGRLKKLNLHMLLFPRITEHVCPWLWLYFPPYFIF